VFPGTIRFSQGPLDPTNRPQILTGTSTPYQVPKKLSTARQIPKRTNGTQKGYQNVKRLQGLLSSFQIKPEIHLEALDEVLLHVFVRYPGWLLSQLKTGGLGQEYVWGGTDKPIKAEHEEHR
jgi:hypothetical protein